MLNRDGGVSLFVFSSLHKFSAESVTFVFFLGVEEYDYELINCWVSDIANTVYSGVRVAPGVATGIFFRLINRLT